jgi:hypothetical protein
MAFSESSSRKNFFMVKSHASVRPQGLVMPGADPASSMTVIPAKRLCHNKGNVILGIKVKKCCCISKNIRESVCKYFVLLYCPTHIIKPV